MQQFWDQKTRYRQGAQNMNAADLYREAGIYAEFGRIICIGVGRIEEQGNGHHLRVTTLHGDHERDILERFVELLNKHYDTDDHWLCGHNGREFDFPYIARRCVVNTVPLPRLLDIAGLKPWEVGHLDTMNLWSFGDRKNFTSLALLTHILGIPTPKDDITGADVARVYYADNDLDRITAYCRKDVVATVQLYLRLTGYPLIPEANIIQV
ncbi:MAG: 3'-5' exonuclease [Flavobacteriales bacterium]|nr:3'-5' exonuclease [Flavobacteriales bacterium]